MLHGVDEDRMKIPSYQNLIQKEKENKSLDDLFVSKGAVGPWDPRRFWKHADNVEKIGGGEVPFWDTDEIYRDWRMYYVHGKENDVFFEKRYSKDLIKRYDYDQLWEENGEYD